MPMDHLMNQAASWAALSSHDGHGLPTFAGPTAMKCRVEPCDYELKLGSNRQVRIVARIFFHPSLAITANDRIETGGVNYRVEKIERFNRIDGAPDHFEALLSEEK